MLKKHIVSFISIIISIIIFLNIKTTNIVIKETIILWYNVILPTIPVSYFLGNILFYFNNCFTTIYPLINKFIKFENKDSFVLYLISFIVGNPTSTILIINAKSQKTISTFEATRLLRSTSFVSLFYILFAFEPIYSISILLGQLVSSLIINKIYKPKASNSKTIQQQQSIFSIIEQLPIVLLNILSTMILSSLIKIPINIVFQNSIYLIPTILSFLELSSGINTLTNLYTNIPLIFFSSMLISLNGLAIILQVIINLKKKMLNIKDYLKHRLIHAFIATSFSIVFFLFIKFFF